MSAERGGHWSEVEERGDVAGMRFLYGAYRLLGRWAFSLMLYPVAAYFCITARPARRASQEYLLRVRRRLEELGQSQPGALTPFNVFREFGRSVLDKAAMWAGTFEGANLEFDNPQLFSRIRESGRGALFIGSHLGNLEVLRAYGDAKQGLKVNALVSSGSAPKLARIAATIGPRAFRRMIEIDTLGPDSVIRLQDKISAGEHIAIAADRVSVRHSNRSIHVPFLGSPAPFPEGPFILASLLACPVYLIFCLAEGKRRYRVFIEEFADPLILPRRDRHKALERAIARYAQRLEANCLRAPTQWFNFFDFWGQSAGDEVNR
jgi:predicted LPLAT superfamily acyltransferase